MAEYTLTPTQSDQVQTVSEWRDDGANIQDALDDGRCPWCEDYAGDYPARHASSAHPEEWAEYKAGE